MEVEMEITSTTRRSVLERGAKGALAFLTVSITARSLGLPAVAQVPQKFVIGSQPINPISSYIALSISSRRKGSTRRSRASKAVLPSTRRLRRATSPSAMSGLRRRSWRSRAVFR
jgi:hypothetical protein